MAAFTILLTGCYEICEICGEPIGICGEDLKIAAGQAVRGIADEVVGGIIDGIGAGIAETAEGIVDNARDGIDAAIEAARGGLSAAIDGVNTAIDNVTGRNGSENTSQDLFDTSDGEIVFALDMWRRSILGGNYSEMAYKILNLTGDGFQAPYYLRSLISVLTGMNVSVHGPAATGTLAAAGYSLGNIAKYIGVVRYVLDFLFLEISIIQMEQHMLERRRHYINSPRTVANIDEILAVIEIVRERAAVAIGFYAADLAILTGLKKKPVTAPIGWLASVVFAVTGIPSQGFIDSAFDAYDFVSERIRNRMYLTN